jgi:PAS domain S-box-containing protein
MCPDGDDSGTEVATDDIVVLHVDDESQVLDGTRCFLEQNSDTITVQSVASPEEALTVLMHDDIDCIVSDYSMPTIDGLDFLRAVRARDLNIPFILFTGKGTEEIAAEAIMAGVTGYVQKRGTDSYTLLTKQIQQFVNKYRADQRAERQLQALETAREGISILDEDGHYLYINEAYADMYGYDPKELLGEHWEIVYPPEDIEKVYEEILPEVPEKGRWNGDVVHVTKGGTRIATTHAISYTESGNMVLLARDITGEREAAQRLADEERRLGLLIESIPNYGIVGLDTAGNIVSWNTIAKRIDGYEQAEILGKHVSALYTAEDTDAGLPEKHLQRAREEGPVEEEGWRVERGGDQFWVQFTLTAVDDAEGAHHGFVCVLHDMTDRTRRERLFQRRLEQLGQFASILSHDIRNPLMTAKMALELARDDPERIETAEMALGRIESLVDSMLELSRKGDIIHELEETSIREAARRAWEVIDTEAATLEIEEFPDSILGDEERLRSLFENLFRNAVEHAGPSVTVRMGACDGGFFVEDDGPGIPPDEREQVIEYGYSTSDGGTGFGLNIVESIATAHGWDVAVTVGTAGGARFEFVPGPEVLKGTTSDGS